MRLALVLGLALTAACTNKSQSPSDTATEKPVKRAWPAPVPEGQALTVAPNLSSRNFYVVFDGSGSMQEAGCGSNQPKIDTAKEAVANFARTVPPDANLGLVVFDNAGTSERVPLGVDNRELFMQKVRAVEAGGGTPLRSSLGVGALKLERQAQQQLGYGEYNLVVVTDGEANEGEDPRAVVDDLLLNSPVIVHTIGFCIGEAHSLNQPGRTMYKAANQPAELVKGLENVLAEAESFDVSSFKP